jgi:hypothetical protein
MTVYGINFFSPPNLCQGVQNGHGEVIDKKEVLEDESDRFLVLEKAITNGKELENDLLDNISESTEKGKEPK